MIGYLCGTARGVDLVVCGGVGYRVSTPTAMPEGEQVELHVVTIVREDAFELYGFTTEAEERLFRLLIKVPRVGAKMGLNLIGSLGAGPLARSIADGDDKALAKVKGVGVKMAQTLVASATIPDDLLLDLNAGEPVPVETGDPTADLDDVAGALVALGYAVDEAIRAAADARTTMPDCDDDGRLVRVALAAMN